MKTMEEQAQDLRKTYLLTYGPGNLKSGPVLVNEKDTLVQMSVKVADYYARWKESAETAEQYIESLLNHFPDKVIKNAYFISWKKTKDNRQLRKEFR